MTTTEDATTEDPVTDPLTPVGSTESASEPPEVEEEPETFPRAYVEELRAEAAANRVKAKRADDLAREVFLLRVSALGKLADATDLPYDEALLEDAAALEVAVDELIARKPHLADRRPVGTIDQGARVEAEATNLASMLRSRAV